jgi:hypothetical protein
MRHVHAASERRRHRIDTRQELGEDQHDSPTPVEGIRRLHDARLRIQRNPAKRPQQPPPRPPAQQEKQVIADQHRRDRKQQRFPAVQMMACARPARDQQANCGRHREPGCFRQYHEKKDGISMLRYSCNQRSHPSQMPNARGRLRAEARYLPPSRGSSEAQPGRVPAQCEALHPCDARSAVS